MFEPQSLRLPLRISEDIVRIEDRLQPENVFDPKYLFKCNVKVLIVTDWFGGFDDTNGFHLGLVLKTLEDNPWSHISINVTKAHRESDAESGVINNFRFDEHDLSLYSQIWMFGIRRKNAGNPVTDAELKALSQFMDEGGGIFATGDYEDLGNSMCARVPRVRSMRRWCHPGSVAVGESVASDQRGLCRHDIHVNGGSQTDAYLQSIIPKLYPRSFGGGLIRHIVRYTHPVLCGPAGPIRYFPDHMQDGCCEVPVNLGNSFEFDGEDFIEYPSKNMHQQIPEVIATANNNATSSKFGVLCAYDGHAVDVGRVAVDASWHHWFNVSTIPFANASNPVHSTFTSDVLAKWEGTKSYYRNLVVWLAKPSQQKCVRNGGWIRTLGDIDIRITKCDLKLVENHSLYFLKLGVLAKKALGRGATQCQSICWVIDLLEELDLPFSNDPFKQYSDAIDIPETSIGLDFDEFETVILGAAIHGAMEKFGDINQPEKLLSDDGEAFSKVLLSSARLGALAFEGRMKEAGMMMQSVMKCFDQE